MTTTEEEIKALEALCHTADSRPADVSAQIKAAYACDRLGEEHRACTYYERAWRLGVPQEARRVFIVCFCSTLRNIARPAEARDILQVAIKEAPDYLPYRVFLGLLCLDEQDGVSAFQTLVEGLLTPQNAPLCDGFDDAIAHYTGALLPPRHHPS